MKQPNLVLPFLATIAAIGLVLKLSHRQGNEATPVHARELVTSNESVKVSGFDTPAYTHVTAPSRFHRNYW